MAQVYIDSLSLENFGPFYGPHTLNFRSLEGKCGILVGGKNGAGKTHLLRALYLAAVGESGVGDLKRVETGADSTKFTLENLLNRRARAEGQDTARLKVAISLEDGKVGGRKAEFVREIRFRPLSAPVWRHLATRADTPGQIDDEQAIQKLRDTFLPRHLARFFFFDAERGQSINLGQQDIVEGVSRILGLWAYTELETDLRQLIDTKIPRVFNSSGDQDPETALAELNGKVITAQGTLRARSMEREALTRNLSEIDTELLEVEDDLKILGVVDPEEMETAQNRRSQLTEAKAALEKKLGEAWELAIPIALLSNYRNELHELLAAEERRREWEGARSTVEPKIPQVKAEVFDGVPEQFRLKDDVGAFYLKRLEAALHRLFHPPPDGIPDRVFVTASTATSTRIRSQLAAATTTPDDIGEACEKIEHIGAECRELDQKLKQMQQNATAFKRGGELHEKRGQLLERREQTSKRLAQLGPEIERMETELSELKRQESLQRDIADRAEKGENLATIARRYREAAGEIRSRAAVQMRQQISQEVGRLWCQIAERTHEFEGMDFDNHWQCWLRRRDGTKATWEATNTSAGQRQIRMLAFYEALRRLAKLVPPLVVDTPLARLDKEVRASVLGELYMTCHQSILLCTNAEIDPDGPLFERIRNKIARAYTLHAHGRADSPDYQVEIRSGYFGRDP